MRTTLDIDDDVLQAAKELARRTKKSAGQVVSELARVGLQGRRPAPGKKRPPARFGFQPFPSRGGVVTNEVIDRLREDDAY